MDKIKPQTLKGFRDFLPQDLVIRQKVIGTLKGVFESYGFQPLETPALEYAETLLGKYGEEADRLIYTFNDRGERKVGLRYDLTVPTARVLAQYAGKADKIPLPFKRYQIQPVWRAEKPQKGRYREFTQCDIDSFGSVSPLADAEIIAVIFSSLKALNFEKFTIRINSRQVLFRLMNDLGIKDKNQQLSALRAIDKLDKQSSQVVIAELKEKGFPEKLIKKLLYLIKAAKPDANLSELFSYLKRLGVNEKFWRFEPTLVRGLDYYTGPIFETAVEKPKIGSICGGGRYDNLVASLGGPNIPATGTTLGLDRLCDVIKEQNLWPNLSPTPSLVLVTVFSPELLEKSLALVSQLRQQKINTEIYLEPTAKLDKQLKYANQKKIPYIVILGPDEVKTGQVTLKNMISGVQEKIPQEKLVQKLS